jgi:hypothetical protein
VLPDLIDAASEYFTDDLLSRRYPERFLVSALAPKYLILLARPKRGPARRQKHLYLLGNLSVCRFG